jgi:dynein light chain Tctex-type 1
MSGQMDDIADSEKQAFQEDSVKKKVREVIESHLKGREYSEHMLDQWMNDICENIVEELYQTKKPFKYVVTCAIMQRTGAAIHSAKSCFWDTVSDASITVCWPKRNGRDTINRTMICIVTVYAISFYPSSI